MQKTNAFNVESWKEENVKSHKPNMDFDFFVNFACKTFKTFWRNYFNSIMHQFSWYFCLLEIQAFEPKANKSLDINRQDDMIISI